MRAILALLFALLAQPAALATPDGGPAAGFDLVVFGEIVETDHHPVPPRDPDADRRPPGLARALGVAESLTPDLLVTTGNQFAGPESLDQWHEQADLFQSAIGTLGVPWIGVPGASERRADRAGLAPTPARLAPVFGQSPRAVELGFALIVTLDTDASPEPGVSRDQIEWLGRTLAESDAGAVLVFLHDAPWLTGGWDDLRAVLRADGRPATVFASAPRVWRDDGADGSIRRYTLGPVFGDDGRPHADACSWAHVTLVRVRPSGVTPVIVPMHPKRGDPPVLPAGWQTGATIDELRELARGDWLRVEGGVAATPGEPTSGSFRVTIDNPTDAELPYRVGIVGTPGWSVTPREIAGVVAPGERAEGAFEASGTLDGAADPRALVRAAIDRPLPNGRTQTIVSKAPVPIRLSLPAGEPAADPAHNGVLSLDGRSGLEVRLPTTETFTLECWVRTDEARTGAVIASCARNGRGFGLVWSKTANGDPRPIGVVYAGGRVVSAPAVGVWDWDRWAHLALSFDGRTVRLFVNGELHQAIDAGAPLDASAEPLAIGTAPASDDRPGSWFDGWIDDLRVRTGAQAEPFAPDRVLAPTPDTIVLYHFDNAGAPGADASDHGRHAWSIGSPGVVIDRPR